MKHDYGISKKASTGLTAAGSFSLFCNPRVDGLLHHSNDKDVGDDFLSPLLPETMSLAPVEDAGLNGLSPGPGQATYAAKFRSPCAARSVVDGSNVGSPTPLWMGGNDNIPSPGISSVQTAASSRCWGTGVGGEAEDAAHADGRYWNELNSSVGEREEEEEEEEEEERRRDREQDPGVAVRGAGQGMEAGVGKGGGGDGKHRMISGPKERYSLNDEVEVVIPAEASGQPRGPATR